MIEFLIALVLMLAVVGGSGHWAVRKQRRLMPGEESHARHH